MIIRVSSRFPVLGSRFLVLRFGFLVLGFGFFALAAGALMSCRREPIEALKLEGNMLTVNNRTTQEWKDVEVWLNYHYRVQTKSLLPYGVLNAPLDMFVAGFGQRFDWRHQQIVDLRLTAKLPDGQPLEIKKKFEQGFSGAISDAVRKR